MESLNPNFSKCSVYLRDWNDGKNLRLVLDGVKAVIGTAWVELAGLPSITKHSLNLAPLFSISTIFFLFVLLRSPSQDVMSHRYIFKISWVYL